MNFCVKKWFFFVSMGLFFFCLSFIQLFLLIQGDLNLVDFCVVHKWVKSDSTANKRRLTVNICPTNCINNVLLLLRSADAPAPACDPLNGVRRTHHIRNASHDAAACPSGSMCERLRMHEWEWEFRKPADWVSYWKAGQLCVYSEHWPVGFFGVWSNNSDPQRSGTRCAEPGKTKNRTYAQSGTTTQQRTYAAASQQHNTQSFIIRIVQWLSLRNDFNVNICTQTCSGSV